MLPVPGLVQLHLAEIWADLSYSQSHILLQEALVLSQRLLHCWGGIRIGQLYQILNVLSQLSKSFLQASDSTPQLHLVKLSLMCISKSCLKSSNRRQRDKTDHFTPYACVQGNNTIIFVHKRRQKHSQMSKFPGEAGPENL